MTTFIIWFPIVLFALTSVLICVAVLMKLFRRKRNYPVLNYTTLIITSFTIFFLLLWCFKISNATPSEEWEEKAKTTDTAILFGFGYVIDEHGKMLPGEANQVLYDMAVGCAGTPVLHMIMQEGVMVAARADTNHYTFTRNLIPMHPIIPGEDVNTLAAARYAIRQMDRLKVKSAVVYAHSMQLARAVYDLEKLAASKSCWSDYEFITPDIQSTPFPPKSAQRRTRSMLNYFLWEIGGRAFESLYLKYINENEDCTEFINAKKESNVIGLDNTKDVKQKANSKVPYYLIVIYSVGAIFVCFILFITSVLFHDDNYCFTLSELLTIVLVGIFWPIIIFILLFLRFVWCVFRWNKHDGDISYDAMK